MRFVPAVLTRNWTLKLSALALAILLWTVVRVDAPTRQVISGIPVRVMETDPDWTPSGDPIPPTVNIRFAGPARVLLQLAFDRPSVVIPVDTVRGEDTVVVIRPEWIRHPDYPGITAEDVQPSSVRLRFEPIATLTLPVRARLEGELPDGLVRAGPVRMEPALVNVSGPEPAVAELDVIELRPLDLGEVESSEPRRVPVDTTGFGRVVVTPGTVRVTVPVAPRAERDLGALPVSVEGVDAVAEPGEASVTVVGPRDGVRGMDPADVRLRPTPGAIPDTIPPDGIRIPLEVVGLPDHAEARIEPTAVTLRPGS